MINEQRTSILERHIMDVKMFRYTDQQVDGLAQRMSIEKVIEPLRYTVYYNFLLPLVTNKVDTETETKEEKLDYVTIYSNWFAHLVYTTWIQKIQWIRHLKSVSFSTVPRFNNTYITNNSYNVCTHISTDQQRKHVEFLLHKRDEGMVNDL